MAGNKKIGIITFHNSYNCGSMLQTYALQTYLNKLKVNNEVIDFSNEGQRNVYSVFGKEKNIKNMIKNAIICLHKRRIETNFNSYEEFKTNVFTLSKNRYLNSEDLQDDEYDIVITGSDQVWNITIEDGDDAYFLPWVSTAKKVAYAPSFGAKNILKFASNPEIYKMYLKSFDYISVRENNGKKWIEELTGLDVPILLDPTLLLNQKDYDKITATIPELPEKYIFYYSPGYSREINKLVNKISKKYNLPVIAFNSKSYFVKGMNFSKFRLPEIENPSTYLTLIKNATLVITTSFHGTIFSTIFKRPFWTIKNGGMFADDDRVITLMQNLSLIDRLISTTFDDSFDYLQTKNYEHYDDSLAKLKKVSEDFIAHAIFNSNENQIDLKKDI